MSVIDDILVKVGLKYEDLSSAEKDTLVQWSNALEVNQLTIPMVRNYVKDLRNIVEGELANIGFGSKQDLFLKARLRNLMLLESFLSGAERAKESLDRAIAGMASNRNKL